MTFEAQQHVPFPLNEVVWDYELIEGATDKEVVIVAIKSDALDEINGAVNDCGLGTAEVDVAPMALYNAFRSTYGQPEEPILLIDIGAKTSNLLYIEGKRFFTRSIAIGGAAVTAAIAKEYNIAFSRSRASENLQRPRRPRRRPHRANGRSRRRAGDGHPQLLSAACPRKSRGPPTITAASMAAAPRAGFSLPVVEPIFPTRWNSSRRSSTCPSNTSIPSATSPSAKAWTPPWSNAKAT